jgi:hypothetical protein
MGQKSVIFMLVAHMNCVQHDHSNSPVGINQLQPLLSSIMCDAILDEDVEAGWCMCVHDVYMERMAEKMQSSRKIEHEKTK